MRVRAWLPTYAVLAAALAACIGVTALVGWALDIEFLRTPPTSRVAMNPVTALAFVLAGAALALQHPVVLQRYGLLGRACGAVVALLALARLIGYVPGADLRLDAVLFAERLQGNVMAPNTAFTFLLLGIALIFVRASSVMMQRTAHVLALCGGLITLLAIIGYAYGAISFYGLGPFIPMALNTALAFGLLSAGIICAQPERGLMELLTSRTTGGFVARRLLPAAAVLPALAGIWCLWGEQEGLFNTEVGVALYAVANTVIMVVFIGVASRVLQRLDAQRQAVEQARETSERRYRQLAEASLDAIIVADQNGRITIFNPAAERVFGYSAKEILGGTIEQLMPAEFRAGHRQGLERYVQTRVPHLVGQTIELGALRKDGAELPIELSLGAAELGGEIQLIGAIRDLTERHRLRSMVVQSEKLASIGLLSAGIAHEINNPLAYVANNLVVLERDANGLLTVLDIYEAARAVPGGVDAETARRAQEQGEQIDLPYVRTNLSRLLTRTREGVDRVARIVQSLRSLARTDRPEMEEMPLQQLIDTSLEMIRGRLHRDRIAIDVDCAQGLHLRCLSTQIGQVLLNLLINAIQAIESTGRPDGQIRVKGYRMGNNTVLDISDNGTGIEPKHMSHLFDPFFTTKEVGEGTGLGLAIAHEIITGHSGRIEVDSQPGQGTRFRLVFPPQR